MSFAIIKNNNRQYRVHEGDTVAVDRLQAEVGTRVDFAEVLMAGDGGDVRVGTPVLADVKVTAEVMAHEKAPKVEVFKFRRRKGYKRLRGHRQPYTVLKILSISNA